MLLMLIKFVLHTSQRLDRAGAKVTRIAYLLRASQLVRHSFGTHLTGGGVEDWEVELLLRRAKVREQVEQGRLDLPATLLRCARPDHL